MVTTQALNVLTQPTKTVYLNEPMNKATEVIEDKTEHQNAPESDETTSAPLTSEEETYKKRYDDLKRHYDNTKTSFESQIREMQTQISDLSSKVTAESKIPKAPKTPEEFKLFKEKYPDLVDHILTAATMVNEDAQAAVTEKLKQLEARQNAYSVEKGIEELKKLHPDFLQIKDDPRFLEWFNMQSEEIKNLIRSPKPEVIAKGLDMFKEYAGIKTPLKKAEAKKEATREVKTPGRVQIGDPSKRTYTEAEIKKMPMKEFELLQDDIRAAQYDGRITG